MAKTVLVTGASRGIGHETAKRFCIAGNQVIINYNSTEAPALKLASKFPNQALAIKADVSDFTQVEEMIHTINKHFGQIDIIVNNAGVASYKLFTECNENEFDRLFSVNVKGIFNVCKAVVPQMIAGKFGKIINISSVWGLIGASCEVLYSASKAAIIGFTKALAKELGPSGITVNCVAPGIINSAMNSRLTEEEKNELRQNTPLLRLGQPHEVAEAILFLASSKADFITGHLLNVDGGFSM
ncbi:MAG: 3-oxoacyl-ACP reductase FabG [Oscillospiraceae bacterium]|jgi:3-oxoacyl-[acyl-carrier protein] reductase|nr:3-oxoacyl-ACP reductase FabG [Oscillospiraceae bacterium]